MDLVIREATIMGQDGLKDIGIQTGLIAEVSDHIEGRGDEEIHAQGRLVTPGLADVHTHLDKALTLDRYDWLHREFQATPRLTSVTESNKLKSQFTVEDVRNRAIRLARMCLLAGTTTLRTHVDIDPVIGLVGMEGIVAAREACRDWIDIQVSPYAIDGFDVSEEAEELLRHALDLGADLMGGVPEADRDGPAHVDRVFAIAGEYNFDIDFHTDQVRAPQPFVLPYIAQKTTAEGMQGRVMASHCYALAYVSPQERRQAIGLCRDAGVSICATPFEKLDERLVEPSTAGVNVTYMSDNIQDTWLPFGKGDMLQHALFVSRLGPWRTNQEMEKILEMGTIGAHKALNLREQVGVAVGRQADLVVLDAPSAHQAIIDQAPRAWVLKRGKIVVRQGQLLVPPAN